MPVRRIHNIHHQVRQHRLSHVMINQSHRRLGLHQRYKNISKHGKGLASNVAREIVNNLHRTKLTRGKSIKWLKNI